MIGQGDATPASGAGRYSMGGRTGRDIGHACTTPGAWPKGSPRIAAASGSGDGRSVASGRVTLPGDPNRCSLMQSETPTMRLHGVMGGSRFHEVLHAVDKRRMSAGGQMARPPDVFASSPAAAADQVACEATVTGRPRIAAPTARFMQNRRSRSGRTARDRPAGTRSGIRPGGSCGYRSARADFPRSLPGEPTSPSR